MDLDLPVQITPEQVANAYGFTKAHQDLPRITAEPCLCKLVSKTMKEPTPCFCNLISKMIEIPMTTSTLPLCYPCTCANHSYRYLIQVQGQIHGQPYEYIRCTCPYCHATN